VEKGRLSALLHLFLLLFIFIFHFLIYRTQIIQHDETCMNTEFARIHFFFEKKFAEESKSKRASSLLLNAGKQRKLTLKNNFTEKC
jgi:hypothetical protein